MGKRQAAAASVGNQAASKTTATGLGAVIGALAGLIGDGGDPSSFTALGAALGGPLGLIARQAVISVAKAAGFGRVAQELAEATAASSPGGAAITGGELRDLAHATIDDVFGYIEGISDESEFGQLRDRLADKGVELGVLYEGDAPPDEPAVAPTA